MCDICDLLSQNLSDYISQSSETSSSEQAELAATTSTGSDTSSMFRDVTAASRIQAYTGYTYTAAWGDFNRDGYPDLWLNNHRLADANLYVNQKDGSFKDESATVDLKSGGATKKPDQHGAVWFDIDNDGDQDVIQLVGLDTTGFESKNQLFINENGSLVNRAETLGIAYPGGRSRDPVVFDFNNDGRLDIMVLTVDNGDKTAELPSTVFLQKADGTFEDAGSQLKFNIPVKAEHGILADFTGDQKFETTIRTSQKELAIYDAASSPFSNVSRQVLDGISVASARLLYDMVSADFNGDLLPDLFMPADNNRHQLLLSTPSGLVDRSAASGLRQISYIPAVGGGIGVGDFDNDMDLDLYLMTVGGSNKPYSLLFENQGNGTFQAVANAGGAVGNHLGSYVSVALADYDLDGFLDILTATGNSYRLFQNTGNSNNWLQIDLQGTVSNRDGVGAMVYVTAGGVTQLRQQDGGQHHRSQNYQRIHVGLGQNTSVDEILIRWPSGIEQRITDVSVNQILRIVEAGGGGNGGGSGGDNNPPPDDGSGDDGSTGGGGSDGGSGTPGVEKTGTKSNDTLSGTADDDTLWGRGGSDTLSGLGGSDRLYGEWGADTLNGGDEDDLLNGGPGRDLLTGGQGIDLFVFEAGHSDDTITDFQQGVDGLDISALTSVANLDADQDEIIDSHFVKASGADLILDLTSFGGGTITFQNLSTLTTVDFNPGTSAGASTISPDAGSGGDGSTEGELDDSGGSGTLGSEKTGSKRNDTLTGSDGDDILQGQGGSDTLNGLGGSDRLFGEWGADRLDGSDGDDLLEGGRGRDQLTGGSGSDVFVFGSRHNDDTITDFQQGSDRLDISSLTSVGPLDSDGNGTLDRAFASQSGNDLVLNLSSFGGGSVRLLNLATLTTDDFVA